MNNLYGITNIRVKQITINTADPNTFEEINEVLETYDGDIIDIQYVSQALGQVTVFITYRKD